MLATSVRSRSRSCSSNKFNLRLLGKLKKVHFCSTSLPIIWMQVDAVCEAGIQTKSLTTVSIWWPGEWNGFAFICKISLLVAPKCWSCPGLSKYCLLTYSRIQGFTWQTIVSKNKQLGDIWKQLRNFSRQSLDQQRNGLKFEQNLNKNFTPHDCPTYVHCSPDPSSVL